MTSTNASPVGEQSGTGFYRFMNMAVDHPVVPPLSCTGQRATIWVSEGLGAVALGGPWLAQDLPFTGPRGDFVGSALYDVVGTSHSPLGALVALALAGLGLAR